MMCMLFASFIATETWKLLHSHEMHHDSSCHKNNPSPKLPGRHAFHAPSCVRGQDVQVCHECSYIHHTPLDVGPVRHRRRRWRVPSSSSSEAGTRHVNLDPAHIQLCYMHPSEIAKCNVVGYSLCIPIGVHRRNHKLVALQFVHQIRDGCLVCGSGPHWRVFWVVQGHGNVCKTDGLPIFAGIVHEKDGVRSSHNCCPRL